MNCKQMYPCRFLTIGLTSCLLLLAHHACGQAPVLVQGILTEPGSSPFHLIADVWDGRESSPEATIEMYWSDPQHWRRTIKSNELTQTLIVSGDSVQDEHNSNYFPLYLQTFVTAMFDVRPLLQEYQPGAMQSTKANGRATESGLLCFGSQGGLCTKRADGLTELVAIPGNSIELSDYRNFHSKRIAFNITHSISVGDFQHAKIQSLRDWMPDDSAILHIDHPTPVTQQLTIASLPQQKLQELATVPMEIIWPQVLDGAEHGNASFYISIDTTGQVREVLPVETANERSNDSAIRQIKRWKFKPYAQQDAPIGVKALLTFPLDTRKYGPEKTFDDAGLRAMATNIVEPIVRSGSFPPGTEYKMWIAVDSDGIIIEKITVGGPSQLFGPCDAALKQWQFHPIMENGQPRPYRGLLVFKF